METGQYMKIKDTLDYSDFKIKKTSKVPYYYQVYMYLLKKINKGDIKIGKQLPNENSLSNIFRVSRTTIRKALYELENNGIISRERGSGTFVLTKSEKTYETEISAFIETADKAQKEFRVNEQPIAAFMSSRAGKINPNLWKPVIRPAKEKYIIAYGTFGKGLWWYHNLVEKSVIDTASSMGCKAIILDNEIDKNKAISNTKKVIEMHEAGEIDFFINAQFHNDINKEISKMLIEAEVPTCGVDVYLDNFPFFHPDDYKLGFIAGEWLGNYIYKNNWDVDSTKFIYFDQIASGKSVRNRKTGTFDGLKSFLKLREENIYIIETPVGSADESKKDMIELLASNSDCHNILITGAAYYFNLGASAALKEVNREKDAIICSTTGTKEDLMELVRKDSSYKAVICTFPETYGNILIPFAVDYLEDNLVPSAFVGYSAVITPDNIERFYPDFLLK